MTDIACTSLVQEALIRKIIHAHVVDLIQNKRGERGWGGRKGILL